ncbi:MULTISPECIES: hypothetical protein [unclassified Shimia]|uniref:hypothetical protein n=1 Tax=unclassified Shimia TaxID=2630038 RepID=UPI0031087396
MSGHINRPMAAAATAGLIFVLSTFGFGWNIAVSGLLAIAAYVGISRLRTARNMPTATAASVLEEPVPKPETESVSSDVPTQSPPKSTSSAAGRVKLGTLLPGEIELAERRGGWRYQS